MNAQARVGLFTLLGLALLFGIFIYWSNLSIQARGYKMGVLFDSVAGLKTGSTVYMAGVPIGTVERIDLQTDFKADVILSIKKQYDIPRDAKFVVTTPLTGEGTLNIEPRRPESQRGGFQLPPGVKLPPGFQLPPGVQTPGPPSQVATAQTPVPLWPREVLPMDEQPRGTAPVSLSDLTAQGEQTLQKLDVLLLQLQASGPQLAKSVQQTVDHANNLTVDADALVARLNTQLNSLSGTMDAAGSNIVALTSDLRTTARRSSGQIDTLFTALNRSSVSLNESLSELHGFAKDPRLKASLIGTAQNLEETTRTLALLTNDLRQVTGDPQTQAQLRNTVANFDAASQRATSLLGELGGKSNVYGVDPQASPYPAGPSVPGGPSGTKPIPAGSSRVSLPAGGLNFERGFSRLAAIDVSVDGLSAPNPYHLGSSNVLSNVHGPQTNINATILPYASTNLIIGANDIGTPQWSMNLAATKAVTPNVRVGGGVLYSNLGLLTGVDLGRAAFDGAIYDVRWPTLDLYGRLKPIKHVQIFAGERDTLHLSRRFTYGVQYSSKP
jgi:ABC-type transporter Mla subunit MlaD